MNSSASYHFASTSFFYSSSQNDQTTPPCSQNPNSIPIPIQSPTPTPIPIPVHYPTTTLSAAATKIQSSYRSHLVRSLIRKILAVDAETDRLRRQIQRQDTVDLIRTNEREKTGLNENLMRLLLRLDAVPGHFDPNVRELRRRVSRRIVGLQEIVDGIAGERVDGEWFEGLLPGSWGEFVEKIWAGEESEEEKEREEEGLAVAVLGGVCQGDVECKSFMENKDFFIKIICIKR